MVFKYKHTIFLHAPCRNNSGFPSLYSSLLDLILSKFQGKYGTGCEDSTTDIWEKVFSALAHRYPFSRRRFPPSVRGFGGGGGGQLQHPCSSCTTCLLHPHSSLPQPKAAWCLKGAEWSAPSAPSSGPEPGTRLCHICFTCTLPHLAPSTPPRTRQDWVPLYFCVPVINDFWTNIHSCWGR